MIELLLQAERMLALGLVDQAERLYRQAAATDPHDAIAVVGLARVALERGDEHEAYAQALRALELDPENATASRLEARLHEVLATRGETVERPDFAQAAEQRLTAGERARLAATAGATRTATRGAPEPGVSSGTAEPAPPRRGLLRRLLGR